jgi:hypothetical protein
LQQRRSSWISPKGVAMVTPRRAPARAGAQRTLEIAAVELRAPGKRWRRVLPPWAFPPRTPAELSASWTRWTRAGNRGRRGRRLYVEEVATGLIEVLRNMGAIGQSFGKDHVDFTGVVPVMTTPVMAMPMPESPSKQAYGAAVGMQLAGPRGP